MSFVTLAIAASSALTQYNQGTLAKGRAGLEAQQMDYQAKIAQEEALQTAKLIRRAGRRQMGAVATAYAGAGVVVGEGSAGEVERELANDVEHDAFQALLEGGRRGRGLTTAATMARSDGSMRQVAGGIAAAGTLLAGFDRASIVNGWKTGRNTGWGSGDAFGNQDLGAYL
jgi:hypothetical protein